MIRQALTCVFAVVVGTLSGCASPDASENETPAAEGALAQGTEVRSVIDHPILTCAGVDVLRLEGVATYGKGFLFEGKLVLDQGVAKEFFQATNASQRAAFKNATHRGPIAPALDFVVSSISADLEEGTEFPLDSDPGSILRAQGTEERVTLTRGRRVPNGGYSTKFIAEGDPVVMNSCQITAPVVPDQPR